MTGSFRIAALAAALVVAPMMARAQARHTIVSLPAENFGFLPFYVAQDTGIFTSQGLDVQKVVLSGVATTNAVISGAADFGFSNGASLTRAAARGQKLLGIAIMSDKPVWAIMMRKDVADAAHFDPKAPLAERAKLFGHIHIFAIDSVNSVGHALVRVIEKIGGVEPESLPVTALSGPDAIAALSLGRVDGFVSNPPWSVEAMMSGKTVMVADSLAGDPPWLTPFGSGVVIARPQFCADHRDICMKMGHALVEAIRFVHERHDDARAILKTHFPQIPPDVLAASFDQTEKSMAATPAIVEAAISNSDKLNVEAGFMKPEDQLKDYKDLFTDEFVK